MRNLTSSKNESQPGEYDTIRYRQRTKKDDDAESFNPEAFEPESMFQMDNLERFLNYIGWTGSTEVSMNIRVDGCLYRCTLSLLCPQCSAANQ